MGNPIRAALERLVAADEFIGEAGPEYQQARDAARAALAAAPPDGLVAPLKERPDFIAGYSVFVLNDSPPIGQSFSDRAALDNSGGVDDLSLTWKMAAFKIGEELAPTGPNGYYDMKPEEWYNWASCQIAKSAPTDDRGVLPMIISETGGDEEPECERIICSSISGGADYINNMPRSLVLERITPEGSIFAHYDQTDSTRPVTDDDLDLLVIAIQALTPHQPDASTHNLAAVDRGREILRNALTRWGRPVTPTAGEVGFSATWDTVAIIAQDMRARGLAEQAAGEELLKAATANRNRADSTTPPTPAAGEVGELVQALIQISDGMGGIGHESDSWVVARAAALLEQQQARIAELEGAK